MIKNYSLDINGGSNIRSGYNLLGAGQKAELRCFNSGNYTATIRIAGGYKVYLEDVTVARNIALAEMVTGRKVSVVFFDENSPKDAVIVAVYA